jgi:hypothetical protein
MSKPTPLRYGEYYHIYNRGNNRENVFIEERNYPYFLKLYAKHVEPIADTYAYCLLRNHFHVLVRIKTFLSTKPTRLKRGDVLGWFDGVGGFDTSHQQEVPAHRIAHLVPEDSD